MVEAQLTRDTEFFGKMDPYCKMRYREQLWKSEVLKNGGKNPKWFQQCFEVDVKYEGDDLEFEIWDSEMIKDDFVGEGREKITSFCINGGSDEWYDIQYKGKKAGRVHLRCDW